MVVLIGAHGTGKSTLLNELKKYRKDLYVSDGWGRPIKEAGKILGLSNKEEQIIINTITKHRWNNDVSQSNFVCTRSIIDEWVYSTLMGHDDLLESRKEIFAKSDYKSVKYFYIPIEFDLEEDGVRYSGKEFQQRCDALMKDWIKEFDLDVVILTGTVEERLHKLLINL